MPRLINTDEDLGAVIGGLAKGAVGFSGYGAPETFTPGGGWVNKILALARD
tara:strand:+ start:125 stop:277 length:153 start_codon:yes stop_codon:yes gene_type:complete